MLLYILESPFNNGNVNINPVINCELIFPSTLNSPLFNFPSI